MSRQREGYQPKRVRGKKVVPPRGGTGEVQRPAPPQPQRQKGRTAVHCTWQEDDNGLWWTECKEIHEFFDGTPTENHYRFCPYCGKALKEVREG